MFTKYGEFKQTMAKANELFQAWEEEYKGFKMSLQKQKAGAGSRE